MSSSEIPASLQHREFFPTLQQANSSQSTRSMVLIVPDPIVHPSSPPSSPRNCHPVPRRSRPTPFQNAPCPFFNHFQPPLFPQLQIVLPEIDPFINVFPRTFPLSSSSLFFLFPFPPQRRNFFLSYPIQPIPLRFFRTFPSLKRFRERNISIMRMSMTYIREISLLNSQSTTRFDRLC